MRRFWRKPRDMKSAVGIGALSVALAVSVAGGLAGCSDSNGDTSTTTATSAGANTGSSMITELTPPDSVNTTSTEAGEQSSTTSTSVIKRVDVSGKSAADYEKEIPDLQKKVESNPQDLAALQELAIAQYQTQRYSDAAATYKKMLAIADEPITHNNYANVLRDWGKNDEAKQEYEKALAADPQLTAAYLNLSSVYLTEESTSKAYEVLDRGIANTNGEDQQRLKDVKAQLQAQQTSTTAG